MPRLCNKQAASIVIWMKRRSAMIMFMTAAAPDAGAAAALDGCIARIAQGSQEALAQLYDRTRPAVYRICLIHTQKPP